MIVPVLAESHTEFIRFIKEMNLNRGHFAYITKDQGLRGYRGLVLTVGNWWSNANYDSDFHHYLEVMARHGQVSVVKGLPSTVMVD